AARKIPPRPNGLRWRCTRAGLPRGRYRAGAAQRPVDYSPFERGSGRRTGRGARVEARFGRRDSGNPKRHFPGDGSGGAVNMLWYKSWMETRWVFLIGLLVASCVAASVVLIWPKVMGLLPLAATFDPNSEIGRKIRESADQLATY